MKITYNNKFARWQFIVGLCFVMALGLAGGW